MAEITSAKANDEKKKVIKTGPVVQRFSQVSSDTLSQFMMDVNTFLFTSKKTW